jgi:succinoglycan biosynthesis protein ExoV
MTVDVTDKKLVDRSNDSEVVVSVEKISKKFCRDLKTSFLYGVRDIATDLVGGRRKSDVLRKDEFWALKDISFQHLLDEDESTTFVGIGTLINEKLRQRTIAARQRIIFSTGAGYVKKSPEIDSSYKVYCLRGPLSARSLGIDSQLAIVDGAILLRRFVKPSSQKVYRFSYMPHHRFANEAWSKICQEIGFGYIDPRWQTEKVLVAINETEILLAEAMHGAIAAEALRVPWVPIVTAPLINKFKWQDWCGAIALEYKPAFLTQVHSSTSWWRQKTAVLQLRWIAKTVRPFLSSDSRIEALTVRLEEKLQQLKRDRA